jgi:cysteine synthase A
LAFVCAVKRFALHIVSSDAFAQEKLRHMEALGARLHIVPSDGGRMTERLTRAMIDRAAEIAHETGSFWTDQLHNTDQLPAYAAMADEIWRQSDGGVDVFVQSVGTGASLRGVATRLRQLNPNLRAIAVEPSESAVLSGHPSGAHRIDGVGAGFVVPLWEPDAVDTIALVSSVEAEAMAERLAREEGIFGGTSTGANVVAALSAAQRTPGATIVTVMCDTGMKYLSRRRG